MLSAGSDCIIPALHVCHFDAVGAGHEPVWPNYKAVPARGSARKVPKLVVLGTLFCGRASHRLRCPRCSRRNIATSGNFLRLNPQASSYDTAIIDQVGCTNYISQKPLITADACPNFLQPSTQYLATSAKLQVSAMSAAVHPVAKHCQSASDPIDQVPHAWN